MNSDTLISAPALVLFVRLLVAHLLGDFCLQHKQWIEHRSLKKWRSVYIYINAGIVAILTWLLSGYPFEWLLPLLVFAAHALTDIGKSYLREHPVVFASDQVLHIAATIIVTLLYLNSGAEFYFNADFLLNNLNLWIVMATYLIVMWPLGIVIMLLTRKWQQQSETRDGLSDAGKTIGILERVLIVTFILIGQFQAVGFLIAAKSVLRFGDISNPGNRKGTEYILIGTMLSFTLAIITALLAQWIIHTYSL